ncbi:hypothetical protein BP6252_07523 [Coleophoma cylindrospora]|uniref:Xylanolytic transcriptional activator regulatory domain-containing protein n=1 Tax=Coleophoma cylindrospora TaxID=1849047 RepID=A0A3D8RAG3_9HELO|nr:hypothetical protein BP6252_07523 [Coleophoma cylindrospora]
MPQFILTWGRRKYWDEDYVHALEEQVHTLLGLLAGDDQREDERPAEMGTGSLLSTNPPAERIKQDDKRRHEVLLNATSSTMKDIGPQPDAAGVRSDVAMEELGVMMWRTNMGDGVTIIDDLSIKPKDHHKHVQSNTETIPGQIGLSNQMLAYIHDRELLCYLADLFLEHINPDHQFVVYRSNEFVIGYPYQSYELVFLHNAILATGAAFSDRDDAELIGDSFAEYAESLAFICCRRSPSLAVVQGLSILSWRSLALGRDQFGWMYISMAAGIAVHLRLHVLALDEITRGSLQASPEEIQTFWMFFIIDRTAISILGRNCALSWRRVNVPDFETTFCNPTADLSQISFAWQCKLWYLHDQYMDQIYAPGFESLSVSRKLALLLTTYEKLNEFLKNVDPRLELPSKSPSKPVLLFHMAYQMALLLTMPPFLRWTTVCKSEEILDLGVSNLVLRTLTQAAATATRLVRIFLEAYGFAFANPVIIHHLLSAAVVHLMNATSSNASLKRQSTRWLRSCMYLLKRLKTGWPTRADKSLQVIRVLAFRWQIVGALPLEFCHPIISTSHIPMLGTSGMDEQNGAHVNRSPRPVNTGPSQSWFDESSGLAGRDPGVCDTSTDSNDISGEDIFNNPVSDQDLMTIINNLDNQGENFPHTINMSNMNVFGDLVNADDFNWLFGGGTY